MSEMLRVDVTNGIATLTLNRPDQDNTLNGELVQMLYDNLHRLSRQRGIHALVLTASGDYFCAGADLTWIQDKQRHPPMPGADPATRVSVCLAEVSAFPAPVIGRINGPAYGAGAGLLTCCDAVIAVDSARFAFKEIQLGLVPAVTAPYVQGALGPRRARRWLLSGASMNTDTALQLGLIDEAVPTSGLDDAINALLAEMLQGAPGAQAETKRWLRQLHDGSQQQSAAYQRAAGVLFRKCLASSEAKTGIDAMIAGDTPSWAKRWRA